jgi:hypothetical protein
MTFHFTSTKSHHTGTTVPQENGASAMRETVTGTGGALKGLKTWIAVSVTLVALLGVLGSSASAAHAESPWWHLTSGTRPAYLIHTDGKAGVPGTPAEPEVQELSIELEPYGADSEQAWLVLKAGSTRLGEFATKGIIEEEQLPESEYILDAAHLKEALEGPYGKGVQVSEETKGGVLSFRITSSPGVEPLSAVPISGVPTTKVTNPGKPEGAGIPAVPDGELYMSAENVGDANVNGATSAVTIADVIPSGLRAVGVAGTKPQVGGDFQERVGIPCKLEERGGVQIATCTFTGELAPYDQLEMRIAVVVESGAHTGEPNEFSVAGGEGSVCREVGAGKGNFSDGGCSVASAGANFERESTGLVAPIGIKPPITVSSAPVPFGVEKYEMALEEEGGAPVTQAGAHPFQFTTTLALNQLRDINPLRNEKERPEVTPPAATKDLSFKLPAGLIGNATFVPQCTTAEFFQTYDGKENECPADTSVGVAVVQVHEPATAGTAILTEPIFNLEPRVGEPARFGFYVVLANSPVFLDTSVRTGEDYGVTVHVNNITQTAAFLSNEVTFWGVPGDSRHNGQRGWGCLYEARKADHLEPCIPSQEAHPKPLLTLPTSCGVLNTSLEGDSWAEPGNVFDYTDADGAKFVPENALTGCNRLQFAPEIKVAPDAQETSKPTGLTVDVHVPQEVNSNAAGDASSNVKGITVKLPAGVAVNPSSADGLEACSEGLVGFTGFGEFPTDPGVSNPLFSPRLPGSFGSSEAREPGRNFCPDAAKIAEVTIHSPLLPANQLVKGFAFLAAQEANPFNSVLAMYIVAEDPISGTVVKLPGEVQICQGAGEVLAGMSCEVTGQLISTFENNPQLSFEDAEFHFFGGERAPLATPTRCGLYKTEAAFTPWSGTPAVRSSSSFELNSGPNHTACVYPGQALPFNPTLTGGATNIQAGAFSPFTLTMSRLPGEQNLQSAEAHLPPGLSGILSNVELCPEPQANQGACGPNSLIGETTVSVGVGGSPFAVHGGKFFLTGPYNGTGGCSVGTPGCAPFGITFEVPAKAGPFDFAKTARNHPACDCVLVRGKIEINPFTAAITIVTNPPGTPDSIPTELEGIPLEIQHVNAITTRSNFQFNPTNCNKLGVSGTIHSSEGGVDTINVPLQVTNCAALKFAPKFSVSTKGKNSKPGGATLIAKLSYPQGPQGTYANITRVKVDLPKQLPSRLTTLQKACTAKQFELNPANCPKESKIGFAKVTTPLLPVPLEGPAIFVSHGNESFPSLTMVLQGYGVTVDLVGTTFISKAGITSTTFKTVPDVPFNTFTLTLPQGKFSALAANVPTKQHYSLCGQTLKMPTEFLAQNGAKINQTTKISVTGCKKAKKTSKKKKNKAKSHKKAK